MASLVLFQMFGLLLLLPKTPLLASSLSLPSVLKPGSSLSVENKDDLLISPNGLFTAGFYSVGDNAYCFGVWFTKPLSDNSHTIVWMANRDVPVNGKRSKLSVLKSGNLVLRDAAQPLPIWTTNIIDSTKPAQLIMNNTGNLYLQNQDNQTIWESFGSPTDTLLPLQKLTKNTPLVSSRSLTNYSSGFYKLYFDSDNVIRLAYNGPSVAGTYWPDPKITAWVSGRSTWASRRTAVLDLSGHFVSSDSLFFNTSDSENQSVRRLTVDVDGNFRAYSLDESKGIWKVTWQAISDTCRVHGICGENSTCSIGPNQDRRCSCIPNHKMINHTDWSYGCKPEFNTTLCGNGEDDFLHFPHYDFYGYEAKFVRNTTLDECKQACLSVCNCKGFHYNFETDGYYSCYVKFKLINGFRTVSSNGSMYLKVPKSVFPLSKSKSIVQGDSLICSHKLPTIQIDRAYEKNPKNESVKFLMIFTYVFGALETICILYFFYRTRSPSTTRQGYLQAATGFQRFSYAELKKATNNFSKEIGRGGGGIVYKGQFSNNRVGAVKLLKEFGNNQGEAGLLSEISTLGRLNHMNLIDMWGYCAETKHKLLVYEYMENGSLAQNLHSSKLDWDKRFDIALGTAKGLAYLHEECLEWVLHCDVKPHNILLDCDWNPKVADFGVSKLLDRDVTLNSVFTRARGTRGYMAPEWLFLNHPITSKVDVYSYGVVMLQMITGRSPACDQSAESKGRLDRWVKEKMIAAGGKNDWITEVIDVTVDGKYDKRKMEILIKVALRCSEEDKDARPTMSQVVDMLLHVEDHSDY
ncbi:putative receptor protein kinase ZmPK1 [Bidens hawaiensis]|uniref:putative receptor protein kinase ZmPK1 n=1 Tax=Bidens hawaiensis TaxID=980011 RepID=UPI00404A24A0